jgi:KDO2-lipid IV(A) lauroyltransferase
MRGLLTYGTYRTLGTLAGPLPPKVGHSLARRAGALLYLLSPKLRRILIHNLSHVLDPHVSQAQVEAVARRACVNIVKGHYDLFRLSRRSLDEIREMVEIQGADYLQEALAPGKGVVLVSAHLGNVDVLGQVPLAYNVPFIAPVQHLQPERLFQYTLSLRKSHGLRIIPADGPLMELVRALKRGEIVGLPCDRGIADNTRTVSFFGSPAQLPDGPIRLALRTGAVMLAAFGLRLEDETFQIRVEPPFDLRRTGDLEADIEAGMELIVNVLERYISQHPEQWLVAAPVWPMN